MQQTGAGYTYPRIYRPGGTWKSVYLALGCIAMALSGAGLWYFGTGHDVQGSPRLMLIGGCAGFFLLGLTLVGCVFRYRLVVQPDQIESTGIFTSKVMRRDDLLGTRMQQTPNGPSTIVLVPRGDDCKPLKIANIFGFDEAFWNWLEPFPDLDEQECKDEDVRLEDDPAFGTSRAERKQTIRRVRRICFNLSLAATAIALWGWFYPHPYRLVVPLLVILPWSAVYLACRYGDLVVINERKRNERGGIGIVFIFPGIILMVRAVEDMNPLGWQRPLLYAIVIGLVLTFAAWMGDAALRKQRIAFVLFFLFSLAYGYGAAIETNAMLDRAPTTVFAAKVRRKDISHGKHTSYTLVLAPWGPKDTEGNVEVSRAFYNAQQIGNPVCIALRPGALGIPWYVVGYCD